MAEFPYKNRPFMSRLFNVLFILWTMIIAASLGFSLYQLSRSVRQQAIIEARAHLNLNLFYRKVIASFGGVYADPDRVRPNPYLAVADRDLTTKGGRSLTLVSPAYLTRIVFENIRKEMTPPVINKITSLQALNPLNDPDEWEMETLKDFEKGGKERSGMVSIEGRPYMRLMMPFMVEQSCLKCHDKQGYQAGEARGGISIAVPMAPYEENAGMLKRRIILSHLGIWLLVSAGLVMYIRGRTLQEKRTIESESRFRVLSESATDWVFWLKEDGGIEYMSPSAKNIAGYTPEELMADPAALERLIHPEDLNIWKEHVKDFRQSQHDEIVLRLITKDGRTRWISHVCAPILIDGVFLGRRSSNRDITERKQAEERLSETNRLLEKIFSTTHILVAYLDRDFNYIHVNRPFAEADDRTPGFYVGKNHFDLYPEPESKEIFSKVVETGEAWFAYEKTFYYAGKSAKGVTYWDWSLQPIKDNRGNVTGLVLMGLNVTERKKAADALRRSEEFTKNVLDSVGEGIIVIDREFRIISANEAYCRQAGRARDKIIGMHCYEISHGLNLPCYRAGETCPVRQTFDIGEPYTSVHRHGDGDNAIIVEIKAFPLMDEDGNIISAIETISDITERTKLEVHLRQTNKMEAVGMLAGGVAHDFNNILSAIIGFANLVDLRMMANDPLKMYIRQILTASERATALTQSLMAFGRKQTVSLRPIDINEIIGKMEGFLRRLIGEEIELRLDLSEGKLTIMGDSGQLEQVLMHLATNARDSMDTGGVFAITTGELEIDEKFVRMHGFGKPGRFMVMTVSDTGCGMDEKTRERIFEPFYTTKETGKGAGLGMSIVYGLMRQNNGHISVYSEPGQGTVFKLYFPAVTSHLEGEVREEPAPLQPGTGTILIAEDDLMLRKLAATVLSEFGYTVVEAADGADAVAKYMENAGYIDLLIFDVIMPKKNGKEAYEEIKRLDPGIKVLFISGYTADIVQRKGIVETDMHFLPKPILPRTLLSKVREILEENR